MSDIYGYILVCLMCLITGSVMGWISAHTTVATECKRLGAFYVGETIYQCAAKEKKE